MEKPKETLVIYRLKFKSEHDFEKAVQTLRFGQNMGKYIESLQRSFALQRPQLNYPMTTTTPPEVNFCKDDLVIYLCSYELFLTSTFGPIADLSVAASEHP